MSLKEYHAKRDFKKTAEPRGQVTKKNPGGTKGLSFVIQKHAASVLHYDFRLEDGGVLKSWAVPKGPSLDPKDKRLAVQVEDHPIQYGIFEGEIPPDEYGGGHVIVWDHGEWIPQGDPAIQIKKGRLEFELKGQKLKGKWILVRAFGGGGSKKKNWLLIKRTDQFAKSAADYDVIAALPKSVISGVTLEKLTADMGGSPKKTPRAKVAKKVSKKPLPPKPRAKAGAKSTSLPEFIPPQLARLSSIPPQGEDWVHEIKFDGYRTIARLREGEVRLITRNGNDWTDRYPSIVKELEKLDVDDAILDGEIVAMDENGKGSFQHLQNAMKNGGKANLAYYLFDLLHLDGEDMQTLPLLERKKPLQRLLAKTKSDRLRYSEHWQQSGAQILKASCGLDLEGIISKRADRPYESGRGADWLKSKCKKGQEFVIGGYTLPKGSRTGFGALLLGVYEKAGELRYVGRVGTGFDQKLLHELTRKLKKLEADASPFDIKSPKGRDLHWVEPTLVANVEFGEWTSEGILRHPSFQGLRGDKGAAEVTLEKVDAEPVQEIALTNPDRVFFPEAKITKRELAAYYREIQKWILPHAKDRPLSLVRCPDGVGKSCFFQKHQEQKSQGGIKNRTVFSQTKNEDEELIYIDQAKGLIELAQIGALELHAWGCHLTTLDQPDLVVLDLDPDESVPFKRVVQAAIQLRDYLDDLGLKSFVKTTGGKGLHVHVPIEPKHSWEEVKAFSKALVSILEKREPEHYTTKIAKAQRKGKIFLDYLRNGYGSTAILPYSVRAKARATVAVPLEWSELTRLKTPDGFDMKKTLARLAKKKDPWRGYFATKQTLPIKSKGRKPRP